MPRGSAQSLLFLTAALVIGCGSTADDGPGSTSDIVRGTPSDAADDAIVQLSMQKAEGDIVATCSGSLVAPNVVLTAYHCVGIESSTPTICPAVRGKGYAVANQVAGYTGELVDPSQVFVSTERTRVSAYLRPAARGVAIVVGDMPHLCSHDIALIVLDKPITGIQPLPMRWTSPLAGEKLTAIGWGRDETGARPTVRMRRSGIPVLGVAGEVVQLDPKDTATVYAVSPGEFITPGVACSGDSGGPILDIGGQILGVTSRGSEGGSECGAVSTFTDVAAHILLVKRALDEGASQRR